ncbi:tRNA:m(4)X modification enzyme TRM13 [Mortierella alpina]|nr:tRNA:m(4)X modification enzyme TRM13 [Mortierella alpina]
MQQPPVICQHSIWGSKQQRYRHCKLPAKLSPALLRQIRHLEQEYFPTVGSGAEEQHQEQLNRFLESRKNLLQSEYDAHKVLCGHHQKEANIDQAKQEQIEREKSEGSYIDPEDAKRLAREQPVDPKDIPKDLLSAIERVFSREPSNWVRDVLDQFDGPEEWKMGRNGRRDNKHEHDQELDDHDDIRNVYPCHKSYENLFSEAGAKKKRHLTQESQVIESMNTIGLLSAALKDTHSGNEQIGLPQGAPTRAAQGPLNRRAVFVEFGAGTGGLSRHLQLVLETIVSERIGDSSTSTATSTAGIEPFNFVLLDRQKFRSRNQVDYMIRTQARPLKPRLLRITKDVRELKLKDLQLIHETEPGVARPEWTEGGGEMEPQESSTVVPTHYVCISKHFCGPATDLALAWMKGQHQRQQANKQIQQDVYSICFATCCHGICEPSLVVAKPYLLELVNAAALKKRKRAESEQGAMARSSGQTEEAYMSDQVHHGISEEQLEEWIPWIIKLTGWATLGKQEESSLVARPGKDAATKIFLENDKDETIMTRDQRRVLGKRCKKLLDMARCMYLVRECGFRQAKAVEYTNESVESGAIVGTM